MRGISWGWLLREIGHPHVRAMNPQGGLVLMASHYPHSPIPIFLTLITIPIH